MIAPPRRPDKARADDAEARAKARDAERLCRFDFLTRPDHEERCVCAPPCSRDYDPAPYPEAPPHPLQDYEGTGVGALYGGPMSSAQAASLAGWNIKPGSAPE